MIPSARELCIFIVPLCLLLGCAEEPTTLNRDVTFRFYSVVATESETTLLLQHESGDETLILQTPAIATEKDITSVKFEQEPESPKMLQITFTSTAGNRMTAATATQGGRIAIVIEDKVWSAPTIRGQAGQHIQISGDFTKEQIERWFSESD